MWNHCAILCDLHVDCTFLWATQKNTEAPKSQKSDTFLLAGSSLEKDQWQQFLALQHLLLGNPNNGAGRKVEPPFRYLVDYLVATDFIFLLPGECGITEHSLHSTHGRASNRESYRTSSKEKLPKTLYMRNNAANETEIRCRRISVCLGHGTWRS